MTQKERLIKLLPNLHLWEIRGVEYGEMADLIGTTKKKCDEAKIVADKIHNMIINGRLEI